MGEIHTRGQAWIECVVAADLRLRNRATGLDLSKTLAKMEVASALLEASKKLSGSADSSTSSSCSATWSSSINEVNDKTGELPNSSAWMGGWGKRTRASSESEGVTTMGSWFSGMRERSGSSPGNQGWFGQPRVRRSSSKDVEEAMAGGLNKSEIFMPPM